MNIKHVFLDLDHTIWDFDENSALCFKRIFEEQKLELDVDLFLKTYIPINFSYWKLFREEKISKKELRYKRLKDVFEVLDFPISDAVIDEISNAYITYLSTYSHLIDGAIDILEYLSEKYQLHIITNGFKEVQHLKIKNAGIGQYFKTIVTSEDIGVKKPNAKIFEFAIQQAKAIVEESIMIGDSMEADVLGAFNYGIKPIHLDLHKTNENTKNEFITVNALVELKQYL